MKKLTLAIVASLFVVIAVFANDHKIVSPESPKMEAVGDTDSNGNVYVCHRIVTRGKALYQSLLVAPSQVAAHLQHGDVLGKCNP